MIKIDANSAENKKSSGNFPYGHFFAMIGGKWKPYLLMVIYKKGSIRFNEMVRKWEVSSKVLSQQLKEIYKWGLNDMRKKELYIDPRTYDYL